MIWFVNLLVILLPVLAHASFRIIGGNFIDISKVPYQVYIENFADEAFCGGSIIKKRTILTAGHCVRKVTDANQLLVYVGTNDHNQQGIVPIKVIQHPGYDNAQLRNDIAIIILEKDLTYSVTVQPVNLPKKNDKLVEGTIGIVAGWGDTILGTDSSSDLLKSVELKTIADKTCENIMKSRNPPLPIILNSFFCTVPKNSNEQEAHGDSGGAFVIKGNIAAGIVSYGFSRIVTNSTYPSVFTRVAYYLDFINANSK